MRVPFARAQRAQSLDHIRIALDRGSQRGDPVRSGVIVRPDVLQTDLGAVIVIGADRVDQDHDGGVDHDEMVERHVDGPIAAALLDPRKARDPHSSPPLLVRETLRERFGLQSIASERPQDRCRGHERGVETQPEIRSAALVPGDPGRSGIQIVPRLGHGWLLPQVSRSPTVRLKTGRWGVESASTTK